jgi:broad specificity phosphatase PhoE
MTQWLAMGTLYLVRHGQASFGAANYDQLSELGWRQSRRLGEHFLQQGRRFDAIMTGTLQRHAQTLEGIQQGLGTSQASLQLPGLNEYDSEALIRAIHPAPLPKPDTPALYRDHFRLLREALQQWMDGKTSPQGMPTYGQFRQGVVDALNQALAHHQGEVLLVSSGGPISTAVGHVLGTSADTTIELNFHIRNSAVSEFKLTPKGHRLISYNTLSHLDAPQYRDWVTFA